MSKNPNPVLDMYKSYCHDPSDPWVSALNAQFDIAECIYRHGGEVPAEWEFTPSPVLHVGSELFEEDASFFALDIDLMMRTGHYSNLVHAGTVLMRYIAQCELAGRNY